MSYSDFTLETVQEKFGIAINEKIDLFASIQDLEISELGAHLKRNTLTQRAFFGKPPVCDFLGVVTHPLAVVWLRTNQGTADQKVLHTQVLSYLSLVFAPNEVHNFSGPLAHPPQDS